MVLLRRECSLEERGRGKGERKERGEEWSHLQSAFGLIQCCGMGCDQDHTIDISLLHGFFIPILEPITEPLVSKFC